MQSPPLHFVFKEKIPACVRTSNVILAVTQHPLAMLQALWYKKSWRVRKSSPEKLKESDSLLSICVALPNGHRSPCTDQRVTPHAALQEKFDFLNVTVAQCSVEYTRGGKFLSRPMLVYWGQHAINECPTRQLAHGCLGRPAHMFNLTPLRISSLLHRRNIPFHFCIGWGRGKVLYNYSI